MLCLNDVIQIGDSPMRRYRLVHINFRDNIAWLYPLFGSNALPLFASVSDLERQEHQVVAGVDPAMHIKASLSAVRDRDAAFERIKPLVESPSIFYPSDRNALINARAAELVCSPRTILRALRAYWAGGQTRNALLPKYHKRGLTEGRTSNRGRPPKYEKRPIFQVCDKDNVIFKEAIDTKYLKCKTATLSGTYDDMVRESYSVIDSEGVIQPKAPGEFPSIEQFRRFFKRHFSMQTVIRKRKGDAEFELNHAAKLGDAELSTYTVGDNYEIDATIADVLLVFRHDRSLIVGKPTLYLIVDSKTWLIVGFYVGLEHASWHAALHAIVSIAEDKEQLCARYGVPYRPDDWPAHGVLPKEFTADRGELFSKESSRLADSLEVTVRNLPAKMAKRKPHVECGFKLIQRPMAEHIPGYVPPENFGKRQRKHHDKDACLTVDEFTGIILRSIIRFNTTPRDDYPLTPEQTLIGLIPTPCNLYNHEVRARAGALPRFSPQYIRNALLPRDEATVSREGIRLGDCYYSCNEAVQRGWFERAARGVFKVTVSYDRRLVDEILIHDDSNPGKSFVATLLEKSAHYRGMSFQEIVAIVFERNRIRQDGRHIALSRRIQYRAAVDPMTKEALAETRRVSKGKSRTSRKKSIVEQRAADLSHERQEKALLSPLHMKTATGNIVHLPAPKTSPTAGPAKSEQRNSRLMELLNGRK